MKEEEDPSTLSRVERSLQEGYWNFPLEPTSSEICAALRARDQNHYDDGYPENLVSLNRFFVMHKVGYRNGKGVKLEGWKTYDDHLMTKTSSGPLNGNDNLVLRIFALRPVIKGVEPIKLCWVKELSKGHQSGRRKKYQPDDESTPNKKSRPAPYSKVKPPSSPPPPSADSNAYPYHPHPQSQSNPHSPNSKNLISLFRPENHIPLPPKQESLAQLSPLSPLSKYNTIPLPGLHVTLAGLFNLPPLQLPRSEATQVDSAQPSPRLVKSEPGSPPHHTSAYRSPPTNNNASYLPNSAELHYLSPPLPPDSLSNTRYLETVGRSGPSRKSDRDAPFTPGGSSWNR